MRRRVERITKKRLAGERKDIAEPSLGEATDIYAIGRGAESRATPLQMRQGINSDRMRARPGALAALSRSKNNRDPRLPASRTPLARLGPILRLLRQERNLSLEDLAEGSGVSVEMLREVEESRGVAPLHLSHLDTILGACGLSLSDLARGERALISGKIPEGVGSEREVDILLSTIESLQDRIDSLEFQQNQRHSATMRAFQVQTIKLLEKTMETSGMSQEDMRRLVSDMQIEDLS